MILDRCIEVHKTFKHLNYLFMIYIYMYVYIYICHPGVTINEGDKILHSPNRENKRGPYIKMNQHWRGASSPQLTYDVLVCVSVLICITYKFIFIHLFHFSGKYHAHRIKGHMAQSTMLEYHPYLIVTCNKCQSGKQCIITFMSIQVPTTPMSDTDPEPL